MIIHEATLILQLYYKYLQAFRGSASRSSRSEARYPSKESYNYFHQPKLLVSVDNWNTIGRKWFPRSPPDCCAPPRCKQGPRLAHRQNKAGWLAYSLREFSTCLLLIRKIERPVGWNICDWSATNSRGIRCTRRHKYRYGGGRMDNYYHEVTVSIINWCCDRDPTDKLCLRTGCVPWTAVKGYCQSSLPDLLAP